MSNEMNVRVKVVHQHFFYLYVFIKRLIIIMKRFLTFDNSIDQSKTINGESFSNFKKMVRKFTKTNKYYQIKSKDSASKIWII
jgi:hypothetical protein